VYTKEIITRRVTGHLTVQGQECYGYFFGASERSVEVGCTASISLFLFLPGHKSRKCVCLIDKTLSSSSLLLLLMPLCCRGRGMALLDTEKWSDGTE
jgi:hypothetical protein